MSFSTKAACAASSSGEGACGRGGADRALERSVALPGKVGGEIQPRLAAAHQLEIDRGQKLAIEPRAVLLARRKIDREAPAQRIEARLRAGIAPPRQRQRVGEAAPDGRAPEPLQLGIEEPEIELGIVDDERPLADEVQQLVGHRAEHRMAREKRVLEPMHQKRFRRHHPLGIYITVKDAAGRQMIHKLDAGDFDDAVAGIGVKARRFGVEHDLAHRLKSLTVCETQTQAHSAHIMAARAMKTAPSTPNTTAAT